MWSCKRENSNAEQQYKCSMTWCHLVRALLSDDDASGWRADIAEAAACCALSSRFGRVSPFRGNFCFVSMILEPQP